MEKTIDKNMRNLTSEMRKAELEMQKDVQISSAKAQNKIQSMYTIIKESLKYVKDVIGFMNFDSDAEIVTKEEIELNADQIEIHI